MNTQKFSYFPIAVLVLWALMPAVSAHAQVAVTSADPSSAPQGTISLDVTVVGNGFDSSAAVSFLITGTTNPGGITVKKVVVRGSKKLVATIEIADTAVVTDFDIQVEMSGGRKGKGTSLFAVLPKTNGDPCAALGLDFPAFVYWKQSGTDQQIYIADATGNCSKPLYLVPYGSGGASSISFSYPIAGSANRGRIVWNEGITVFAGDFSVSGTNVTIEPQRVIPSVACCVLALSPDGLNLYARTDQGTLEKISIADPSNRQVLRTIDTSGNLLASTGAAAVNGDQSAIYVSESHGTSSEGYTRIDLVRVDLATLEARVLASAARQGSFWPAADPGSNRIAYTDYVPGSNNCYLLQIADGTTGAILSYGQPRYGVQSTWHAGKILTNGYKSPNRQGRCLSLDAITEVDPLTSTEKILTNGHSPDAR